MFSYCGNNPVNRADATGHFWKEIGDFLKGVGDAIGNYFKSTFGAGSSIVNVIENETNFLPDIFPISYSTGERASTTLSKNGDSSKPWSVYAEGRSDNLLLSSAGLKINILKFTLNISVGLDDIGIRGSYKSGNTINSWGVKADINKFRVGFEYSNTVEWDEYNSSTFYENASITGMGVATGIIFVATAGQVSLTELQQQLQRQYA